MTTTATKVLVALSEELTPHQARAFHLRKRNVNRPVYAYLVEEPVKVGDRVRVPASEFFGEQHGTVVRTKDVDYDGPIKWATKTP